MLTIVAASVPLLVATVVLQGVSLLVDGSVGMAAVVCFTDESSVSTTLLVTSTGAVSFVESVSVSFVESVSEVVVT